MARDRQKRRNQDNGLPRLTLEALRLRVEDAWSQKEVANQARDRQAELGWVLDPALVGRGSRPRLSASCCASASTTWGLAA